MNIVITGAEGFIGRNLSFRLREYGRYNVIGVSRQTTIEVTKQALTHADFVYHLAGVNRPKDADDFWEGNTNFTKQVIDTLSSCERNVPIMFSSSSQAALENPYGKSKLAAEELVRGYSKESGAAAFIYRLPNVFGKWCKPNYNSFVATFCHNLTRNEEISINNASSKVTLAYVDDVCDELCSLLLSDFGNVRDSQLHSVPIQYETTVGEVAEILYRFKASQEKLTTEDVGVGLERALFATYLSYLSPNQFRYEIPIHRDERGSFCEMLKTASSGQFSYFTAGPGVTRGGHYHHSKNEKFLVIRGQAKFKFENILTGQRHTIIVDGGSPEVIVTAPGWCHDITNVGNDELIVMLWANEVFDKERPDTVSRELFRADNDD